MKTSIWSMVALAASLGACAGGTVSGGGGAPMSTAESLAALRANDWDLVQLPGISVLPDTERPSLQFAEDGRVTGFSGCNPMTGTFEVEANALTFGPIVMTRRACMDGRLEVETAFARAIEMTRSFGIRDGALSLLGAEGTLLARLVPAGG